MVSTNCSTVRHFPNGHFWHPENIKFFQNKLKSLGYLYIPNLPENFQWIGFSQLLTDCKLMPQDEGKYIDDVQFNSQKEHLLDSKSCNLVPPYTEANYILDPPKYLSLHCLNPAACGGGDTQLFSVDYLLLFALTESEQQQLMQPNFTFISKDKTKGIKAPILEFFPNSQLQMRFSFNTLLYGEPSPSVEAKANCNSFLQEVCNKIALHFYKNHIPILMEKNSLLIFNNQSMLHARTAFEDSNRHLQRIWLI